MPTCLKATLTVTVCLQHLDEERLAFLVRVMRLVSGADANIIACSKADHVVCADAVDSADPHSDLRLFLHNKTVDIMLRQLALAQRLTREKVLLVFPSYISFIFLPLMFIFCLKRVKTRFQ